MRRSAAQQASISLFPFLAVLICTMGALVLLLLGLTQSMRHRLSRPAVPPTNVATTPVESTPARVVAPPAPEPRAPAPDSPSGYDRAALLAARDQAAAELAAAYAARVETAREELNRLQTRFDELRSRRATEEAQAGELTHQGEFQANRSQAARVALELAEEKLSELERQRTDLKAEIALTERRLADLQARQSTVSNEFAVVPYEGRSGTQRRPISIECTDRGFRFLPEQVLVGAAELRGGTARVNALGMGTRALLRYWTLKHAREPAKNPKPYVLLLVRPSGIYGYDAARQLLAGLETSFGYELIDEKLPLASPPPDPQAVAVLKEAIQLAMESGDPAAVAGARKQVWDEELQRPVEQGRRTNPGGGRGAPGELPDDRIDGGGSPVRSPVATTPRSGSLPGDAPEGPGSDDANSLADRAGLSGTSAGMADSGPETGAAAAGLPGAPRGRTGPGGGSRPSARPATLGGGRPDLADTPLGNSPEVGVPSREGLPGVRPGRSGAGPEDLAVSPPARLPPPGQSPPTGSSGGAGRGTNGGDGTGDSRITGRSAADSSQETSLRRGVTTAAPFPGGPGSGSSATDPLATAGTTGEAPGSTGSGTTAAETSERGVPQGTSNPTRPPLVAGRRPGLQEPLAAPRADTPGYAEIPESPQTGEAETSPGVASGTGRDGRGGLTARTGPDSATGESAQSSAATPPPEAGSAEPDSRGATEGNPFLREMASENPPLAESRRPQTPGRPRRGSSNPGGPGRPTNERSPISKPDPDDPLPSGPGAGGPGVPLLGGKRGAGPQRNLIGLERKIRIRVEPTRVLVGEDQPIEIVVKRGMKSEQLVGQVTSAMGQVVENWGPPPARFYWIPAVRFEVTREGNAVYERLRGAFERNQVKSSVDYVTPAGQTVGREDR